MWHHNVLKYKVSTVDALTMNSNSSLFMAWEEVVKEMGRGGGGKGFVTYSHGEDIFFSIGGGGGGGGRCQNFL